MLDPSQRCVEDRLRAILDPQTASPDRALKNLRYVVGAVNEDARRVWEELWRELQGGVTPGGMVTPELEKGFQPSCGWPEFLEKFWLLKHYLDWMHRFSK